MLCQCGCGLTTNLSRQNETKRGYVKGQPMKFVAGHRPRPKVLKGKYRQIGGDIYEHVAIASAALGKPLPLGAEVHHVDGNSHNNQRTNLVICQDKAYHRLLEYRTRIIRLGGDPNTQKPCADCRHLKAFADFNVCRRHKAGGLQNICRDCQKSRDKAKRSASQLRAAAREDR